MGMTDTTTATPISTTEEQVNKHYIIGDNLRHKAFYEDAVDEYQRALCEQEPELGANSTIVAKTHYGLGLSFRFVKEYKQAIHHLKTAVEIFEAAVDPNNNKKKDELEQDVKKCKINLARTYHSHGVDLQRGGDYDRSILEHRKAVAIREHTLGRSHLETARSYYVIGCALSDRGNFDEALGELRRALRTRLLVFGKEHMDVREVVENIGTVLYARGGMDADAITEYKMIILCSLEYENEGDDLCRKEEYENGMVCYRKGLSLEEQCLGDLHPTTCDLYLRMADAMSQIGDLQASLVEYKSAITIYERMVGKFHVKMANIYNKLAGVLMEKGEYETALSFYAKTYAIYDTTLGLHDDTKQALADIKKAAEKSRGAKTSMDILVKVEEEFKKRHPSVNGEPDKEKEEEDKKEEKMNGHVDSNKENVGATKKDSKAKAVVLDEEPDII